MAAHTLLLELFKSCQEKTNDAVKSFETDHFTWLEEAVVAARQTFAHKEIVLLPITPAAKKNTRKRPINKATKDEPDSDEVPCPPAKRSLVVVSPEEKPRRGRAASRAAQQKIKSGIAMENFKGKLRRPSLGETLTTEPEEIEEEEFVSPQSQNNFTLQTKKDHASVSYQEPTPVKTPVKECSSEVTPMPTPSPTAIAKDQDSPRKKSIVYGKRDVSFMNAIKESDDSQEESDNVCETADCVVTDDNTKVETEGKDCVFTDDNSEVETEGKDCIVTDDNSGVETEGRETESSDEPAEMSPLQLNETEVITNLNETEVISKLNETEIISKLNETEVIFKFNETKVTDKNESVCKLNETVIISKHNETGVPCSKLNETEVIKLTLTSDEDHKTEIDTTESETENLVNNEKMSEPEEYMPPPVEAPKSRTTRTKTRGKKSEPHKTEVSTSEDEVKANVQAPKPRSTRTKKKNVEEIQHVNTKDSVTPSSKTGVATSEDEVITNVEVTKPRSTRTKKKNAEETQVNTDTVPPSPKPRSTRTKKRLLEEEKSLPEQPTRSTRTKRKKEEEKAPEPLEESIFQLALSDSEDEGVGESLDGKEMAINSTFVKTSNKRDHSVDSVSSEVSTKSVESTKSEDSSSKEAEVAQPPRRVTRSKVRPAAPVRDISPKKTESSQSPRNRASRTPVKQTLAKTPNKQYSPRPFASKTGSVKKMAEAYQNYVIDSDEAGIEETSDSQSPRVIRHSKGNSKASNTKRESYAQRCARKSLGRAKAAALAADARMSAEDQDVMDPQKSKTKGPRINPETKTPTKTPDCPSDKVVRPRPIPMTNGRVTPSQSGRITPKTFSRVKPIVSAYSSSNENRTKKVFTTPTEMKRTKSVLGTGTPNDMKRPKNIISGVNSFIKVQPSKPTKEEIEEKKKEELRKKKERGEEGKRKRDEMIMKKMEEQKKRNEERMRRVQEARAERERKVIETKQQQDSEKKIREERLKEEQLRKKQQAIAKKKAEEELRLQKIREQQEEDRRRKQEEEDRRRKQEEEDRRRKQEEEDRRRKQEEEERRRKDEERRKEEEKRKIAEENRIAEEARKAEAERKAKIAEQRRIQEEKQKRAAEAERIARERQELERLRQREAERLANSQKKNQTLNETYNTQDDKENSTTHNSTYTKPVASNSNNTKKERNDSYEMTPERKPPPKKRPADANCYDINDIGSSDSTDDETQPKKQIPSWAQGTNLKAALVNQEYFPPDIHSIFPPYILLQMPNLSEMFPIQRRKFHKRGSSAIWNTPPSKLWAS